MQIFVSDMGYVYMVAMNSVKEFSKTLKMFAKEVGVPEAIVADSHNCHKSKEVKLFSMTLRNLDPFSDEKLAWFQAREAEQSSLFMVVL